jgi:hypothetical protein
MKIILFSENNKFKMYGVEVNQGEQSKFFEDLDIIDDNVSRVIIERISKKVMMIVLFNKKSIPIKEKKEIEKKISIFKQLLQQKSA